MQGSKMTKRRGVFIKAHLRCGAYLLPMLALGWGSEARAEQPTMVIAAAPLVTPSSALTYFGSPASPAAPR